MCVVAMTRTANAEATLPDEGDSEPRLNLGPTLNLCAGCRLSTKACPELQAAIKSRFDLGWCIHLRYVDSSQLLPRKRHEFKLII